jgi:hypothetical protein
MPVWIGGLKQKRKKQRKKVHCSKIETSGRDRVVWCRVVSVCVCGTVGAIKSSLGSIPSFMQRRGGGGADPGQSKGYYCAAMAMAGLPTPLLYSTPSLSARSQPPGKCKQPRQRKGDSTVDYQTNPPVCLSPHVCARPLTCIYISNSVSLQRRRKQRITFPYPHRVAFVAFLPPPPGPNPLPWGGGGR